MTRRRGSAKVKKQKMITQFAAIAGLCIGVLVVASFAGLLPTGSFTEIQVDYGYAKSGSQTQKINTANWNFDFDTGILSGDPEMSNLAEQYTYRPDLHITMSEVWHGALNPPLDANGLPLYQPTARNIPVESFVINVTVPDTDGDEDDLPETEMHIFDLHAYWFTLTMVAEADVYQIISPLQLPLFGGVGGWLTETQYRSAAYGIAGMQGQELDFTTACKFSILPWTYRTENGDLIDNWAGILEAEVYAAVDGEYTTSGMTAIEGIDKHATRAPSHFDHSKIDMTVTYGGSTITQTAFGGISPDSNIPNAVWLSGLGGKLFPGYYMRLKPGLIIVTENNVDITPINCYVQYYVRVLVATSHTFFFYSGHGQPEPTPPPPPWVDILILIIVIVIIIVVACVISSYLRKRRR